MPLLEFTCPGHQEYSFFMLHSDLIPRKGESVQISGHPDQPERTFIVHEVVHFYNYQQRKRYDVRVVLRAP